MTQTFAAELQTAMAARRLNIRQVSERCGVHYETVAKARQGKHVPTLAIAKAMADVLEWQTLAAIVDRASTKRCVVCRHRFVTDGYVRTLAKYCSDICKRSHRNEARYRRKEIVTSKHLDAARRAVEAFCRSCEPTGPCRDSGCPLRPVSPLPFIALTRRAA